MTFVPGSVPDTGEAFPGGNRRRAFKSNLSHDLVFRLTKRKTRAILPDNSVTNI